jgi:hypothetical protein
MSRDITVVKVFSNEMDAVMAQELLHESGIRSFVSKDDAGGMEPYLQLTNGVRLIVNQDDAVRASEIIRTLDRLF